MLRERWPELATPHYPALPEEARVHPRRGHPRRLPRLAPQAAGDDDPSGAPGGLHIRDRVALADGYPHELRAADYDDWSTETVSADGRPMHGLNGDILVWNPVTRRRHELMSGGIRVTKESLRTQLELSNQLDFLELPYHRAILNDEIPLSIGAGIGQSRTMMLLLRKAHLGEVSVSVWPQVLKEMCARAEHPRAPVVRSRPIGPAGPVTTEDLQTY